jgi:hypothetical protein
VNFGTKALAALIAYREYALGRRSLYGVAAWHWLEEGGSAWLLYYSPGTAYIKVERVKVERPVAVEEMVADALRRLFLNPAPTTTAASSSFWEAASWRWSSRRRPSRITCLSSTGLRRAGSGSWA